MHHSVKILSTIVIVFVIVLFSSLYLQCYKHQALQPQLSTIYQVLESSKTRFVVLGSLPTAPRRLVIGIPSVWRGSYGTEQLTSTIGNLFEAIDDAEYKNVLVVIYVADQKLALREKMKLILAIKFQYFIQIGSLIVIEAPDSLFPPLYNKQNDYHDSPERTKWRQKQCLDISFLMAFSHNIAPLYLHLEDDIQATRDFLSAITTMTTAFPDAIMFAFSSLGFIGKAFPTNVLPKLATFIFTFYLDMPADILLEYFLSIENRETAVRFRKPPLFQHNGMKSSLKGKEQSLQESDFELPYDMKLSNADNPPAKITSSMTAAFSYVPSDAYIRAPGGFWAREALQDSTFNVTLQTPTRLSKVTKGTLAVLFEGVHKETELAQFQNGFARVNIVDSRRVRKVIIRCTATHHNWVMIQDVALFRWET
eukprot:gene8068-10086_t